MSLGPCPRRLTTPSLHGVCNVGKPLIHLKKLRDRGFSFWAQRFGCGQVVARRLAFR